MGSEMCIRDSLEGVDAVLVRDVCLQIVRQVDDLDGLARAVLCAVEARQTGRLEDDAHIILHLNAFTTTHARVLLEVHMRRHVWLALLLVEEQHARALLLAAGLIGLTLQALA